MRNWFVTALVLLVGTNLNAAPVARSISTSGQFIVYGADARLRGAICDLAEDAKRTALELLQERDAWKTPIIVNARLPQANLPELPPARLTFSQTGAGLKLQLDLCIDRDVNASAIERELLRGVYLGMMYRAAQNTPAGMPYVEPPDWLLDGTLSAKRDPAEAATLLKTPVETENIVSLGDILRTRVDLLDAPSRELFDAYSAALVSSLNSGPDGPRHLARFVADLPQSSNDTMAEFQKHFPDLGETPDTMQKNWMLIVTQRAASERYRFLAAAESEQELAQILRVEVRERDQPIAAYSLEEFPRFIKNAAKREALEQVREQLLLLSGRANPLYRPVIAEYDKILVQLSRGKAKRLLERLAALRAMREQLLREMDAIADFMNWFEATQSRTMSGEFRDYLKTATTAPEREPHRHDAISVYLDAAEAQF